MRRRYRRKGLAAGKDEARSYEDIAYGFSHKALREGIPQWVGGYPLEIVCPSAVTYVIGNEPSPDVVKIGKSRYLHKRFAELQTASPLILRVLRVIDGEHHEQILHRNLEQFRRRGEWFEYTDEVRAYLNRYHRSDKYFYPL